MIGWGITLPLQVVIVIVALVWFTPPADASHKRYEPQVREARHWLKKQVGWHQWKCLDTLWLGESHWRVDARNPTSGAFGLPQAVPGRKMRTAGKDWRTSAMTQAKWGRRYIRARYGKPCAALRFRNRHGW